MYVMLVMLAVCFVDHGGGRKVALGPLFPRAFVSTSALRRFPTRGYVRRTEFLQNHAPLRYPPENTRCDDGQRRLLMLESCCFALFDIYIVPCCQVKLTTFKLTTKACTLESLTLLFVKLR